MFTPIEARQGLAQKIFYVHAPSAWSALLAFSMGGLAGGLYLWLRDPRLDVFAESSAEVGLVFSAMMLTTGPLWGKPIWGTWWQWEPRLTLTLLLVFLFVGYLALRNAIADPSERARYSAIVGLLGLILVPFVHLSVYLFRTIHPQPILLILKYSRDSFHHCLLVLRHHLQECITEEQEGMARIAAHALLTAGGGGTLLP